MDELVQLTYILENIYDGVILADMEGHIIEWNASAEKIFGYTKDEVLGKSTGILHRTEESNILTPSIIKTVIQKGKWSGEIKFIRKDKTHGICETVVVPINDEKGNLVATIYINHDITEQKQAEKSLSDSDIRMQVLLDNVVDGIITINKFGIIESFNKAAEQLFGYVSTEVIGKNVKTLMPEPYYSEHDNYINNFLKTGVSKIIGFSREVIGLRKNGTTFPMSLAVGKVYLDNELLFTGIVKDITDRKHAEETLKQSNDMLNALRKAQSDFISDGETRALFDKLLNNLLSLTQSEYGFIGEVLYDSKGQPYLKTHAITNIAWNKETREFYENNAPSGLEFYNLKTLFGEVMTTGKPVIANDPYNDSRRGGLPKGHPPLNAFLGLPFYKANKLIGMVGISNHPNGYDETIISYLGPFLSTCANLIDAYRKDKLRIATEIALRRSEIKNKALLNAIPDMIFRIKDDGTFLDFKAAKDFDSLVLPEEFIGKKIAETMPPKVAQQVLDYTRIALQTTDIQAFDYQLVLNNNPHDYEARIVASGENEVLAIVRDITDRKQAEKQQAQLVKELEAINDELKSFAHIVSHDLKAPLRGIASLADWISQDYADQFDENGKEQINLLKARVKRMYGLIEGILQYSRVGRIKEEKVKVDLNEIVTQTINSLALPENMNIKIENKLPTIIGEKTRITQLFQNLLSNAVKFIDKPIGKITVNCVSDHNYWKLSISDNGPGIDKIYYDKIFQVFQTLNPRDKIESTGVGLSIVKKIVEQSGGKVWVESEVGVGSTFFFTLPKEN